MQHEYITLPTCLRSCFGEIKHWRWPGYCFLLVVDNRSSMAILVCIFLLQSARMDVYMLLQIEVILQQKQDQWFSIRLIR